MTPALVALSYVVTFGGVGVLSALMIRRARRVGAHIPPEDRPWT